MQEHTRMVDRDIMMVTLLVDKVEDVLLYSKILLLLEPLLQSPARVADQDIQFNRAAQVAAISVEMQPQLGQPVAQVEHKVQVAQEVPEEVAPQEHNYLAELQPDQTDQVEVVVGMAVAQEVMMAEVAEVALAM